MSSGSSKFHRNFFGTSRCHRCGWLRAILSPSCLALLQTRELRNTSNTWRRRHRFVRRRVSKI